MHDIVHVPTITDNFLLLMPDTDKITYNFKLKIDHLIFQSSNKMCCVKTFVEHVLYYM